MQVADLLRVDELRHTSIHDEASVQMAKRCLMSGPFDRWHSSRIHLQMLISSSLMVAECIVTSCEQN
jgi:hypothetical protein